MGQARKRHDAGEYKPHVKKGDEVLVIAGRSNANRGRVISVDPQRERALVEGVNTITKHQRPSNAGGRAGQQGGRIEQPSPVHVSNLMVVCPSCNTPTRVSHRQEADKWVRACKRCSQPLDRAE